MPKVGQQKIERTMAGSLCRGLGVGEVVASALVEQIIEDLRASHGGAEFYIPVAQKKADVADMARQMFNGSNAVEVCDRLNISKATLYRHLGRKP